MKKLTTWDFTEWQIDLLKSVKKALVKRQGGVVIACVKSVARSGMSRRISFMYVDKKGGSYLLDSTFAKLLEWPCNDRGILVSGCGMDMVFHTFDCVLGRLGVKQSYKYASNYKYM